MATAPGGGASITTHQRSRRARLVGSRSGRPGMGFDYFYGFNAGDSSQWEPMLTRNTAPITPFVGQPGWNLITAMADDAIDWMTQLNDLDPTLPFFIYYAPGATHAPHHPTSEWI